MTTRGHGPAGVRRHNLPAQQTPLHGRDGAIEAARHEILCDDVRLLTLTGPSGIGKTRLGIAVTKASLDAFPEATALHAEALVIRETIGDRQGLRESLHGQGDAALFAGNRGRAEACFERGLANAEEVDDTWGQRHTLPDVSRSRRVW